MERPEALDGGSDSRGPQSSKRKSRTAKNSASATTNIIPIAMTACLAT
jgi:hypothetical protein